MRLKTIPRAFNMLSIFWNAPTRPTVIWTLRTIFLFVNACEPVSYYGLSFHSITNYLIHYYTALHCMVFISFCMAFYNSIDYYLIIHRFNKRFLYMTIRFSYIEYYSYIKICRDGIEWKKEGQRTFTRSNRPLLYRPVTYA